MSQTTPSAAARRVGAEDGVLPPGLTPDGTRGRVLEAGLRLFAESGFAGASIRDIAKEAGVQPATLYGHYPSKEHLLSELVRLGHEEHHRRLRAGLLESQPDPSEQLAALVRAHVRMHTDFSMLAVVANSELHALSQELAGPSLALRESSTSLFVEVIRRGADIGTFSPPHVWLAVAAIGGMGIRVASWFAPTFELDAAAVADVYADFALRIVRGERISF